MSVLAHALAGTFEAIGITVFIGWLMARPLSPDNDSPHAATERGTEVHGE